MFCNQCGTQVPDTATICFYCGATLTPVAGVSSQTAPQIQNADTMQTANPQIHTADVTQVPLQPVSNANAVEMSEQPIQNRNPIPEPAQQAQNIGPGQGQQQSMPNAGAGTGYGQPGMQQPNQQMYYGAPMTGYSAPRQSAMANLGMTFKNAPGEFAGKVKRMGVSVFCLLGIIAAMLFIVAPFMNFASIHVDEKVEVPSYYSYMFGSSYGSSYRSEMKIKAGIGLDLFELAQLSGTVERLAKSLGGSDTGEIADAVEQAEDYIVHGLEYELDTEIKNSSVKEVFGTVKLILKGHTAALVTPWVLIVCGIGLLIFSVINNRKLKLVFSLIPLAFLIWLIACSGHFFSIMGIGAWAIIIGIVLGVVSTLKDA